MCRLPVASWIAISALQKRQGTQALSYYSCRLSSACGPPHPGQLSSQTRVNLRFGLHAGWAIEVPWSRLQCSWPVGMQLWVIQTPVLLADRVLWAASSRSMLRTSLRTNGPQCCMASARIRTQALLPPPRSALHRASNAAPRHRIATCRAAEVCRAGKQPRHRRL